MPSLSETRTQIWEKSVKSLKTLFKKNKWGLVLFIIGMLIMIPFMYRSSYEQLDIQYYITTDDLPYAAYYQEYFGEPVTLPSVDVVIICLMNLTVAVYLLIGIQFQGDVDILRVGVLKHDTTTLMYDKETPAQDLAVPITIEDVGIYSCAVFFHPNGQYSINMDIIYLS